MLPWGPKIFSVYVLSKRATTSQLSSLKKYSWKGSSTHFRCRSYTSLFISTTSTCRTTVRNLIRTQTTPWPRPTFKELSENVSFVLMKSSWTRSLKMCQYLTWRPSMQSRRRSMGTGGQDSMTIRRFVSCTGCCASSLNVWQTRVIQSDSFTFVTSPSPRRFEICHNPRTWTNCCRWASSETLAFTI